MSDVKSLKAFTDKETGVFHKKGDAFSCKAERAKELAELGVVEIVSAAKAPAKKKPVKKTAKK